MKKQINPQFYNLIKGYGFLISFCLLPALFYGQERVYDNFEGDKVLFYGERFGVLDTNFKNPAPNKVNNSPTCGMYVRNATKKFANIKMNLPKKITGVEAYSTYLGNPPQIKLKVNTTAPVGTLVEVLLGAKRGNNDYPAGTHSQYQAYTTVSGQWEELTFKFSQIPQGSETGADQIDQVVLLFNPNSSTSDTYYFDDLTGPPVLSDGASQQGPEKTDKPVKKEGKNKTAIHKGTRDKNVNKK